VRNLITLILMALPPAALAAGAVPRPIWHADVVPPRPGLPAVSVDLGYPGPYVSPYVCPITLHAVGGALPFDGYIGFRFAVNNKGTANIPIVARAVLRPHQPWTFTTTAQLNYFGELRREIALEWLDRSTEVVATSIAGIPPWSARPHRLRVLAPGQSDESAPAQDESIAAAESLPDVAIWYRGFGSFVIPLAVWLQLPVRIRDAVFASGIFVVFSGPPEPGQQLDAMTQALLPVTFEPRPGSYRIPWPYAATVDRVMTSVSWKARTGTAAAGSREMPYIVSNHVAAWVADTLAASSLLPAMEILPLPRRMAVRAVMASRQRHVSWPLLETARQIGRSFIPLIVVILVALLSLAIWMAMRRQPRVGAAIVALVIAAVIVIGRNAILPSGDGSGSAEALYRVDGRGLLAPGIVGHLVSQQFYGAMPLAELHTDSDFRRRTMTARVEGTNSSEIRDATTAPGWGMAIRNANWDSISRMSRRRELGETATVRVKERDGKHLVFEYQSPVAIDRIIAEWVYDDGYPRLGEAAPAGKTAGTVTIENGRMIGSLSPISWADLDWSSTPGHGRWGFSAIITFVHEQRKRADILEWRDSFPDSGSKSTSFLLDGWVNTDGTAEASRLFALPLAFMPPNAVMQISIPKALGGPDVAVSSAAGEFKAIRTGLAGAPTPWDSEAYAIPSEELQKIVNGGGILRVTLGPPRTPRIQDDDHREEITVEVWEKKP
jgi:hypothetical protein